MVVISWNDSYTVHVESIDKQHKMMMRLINDLSVLSDADHHNEEIEKALNEVLSFTKDHFNYEESFLEKYKYPFYEAHKAEHADFLQSVSRFKKEINNGQESSRKKLVNYMVSWLKSHIQKEDKQYVCFMLEHGIK